MNAETVPQTTPPTYDFVVVFLKIQKSVSVAQVIVIGILQ